MARTYPLSLSYKTCLGHQEDPFNFSSLYLEDLHNGQKDYIENIEQLINAIPKSMDPASRFALRAHVAPPGHQRVRYSYVQPSGGYCLQMETSDEHQTAYITSSHARDGVWSCEGVILPCRIMIVVSTGFMIQPHPRLVAWNRQTQCLAVTQVKIPITQCPGIFLTPFPVLRVATIPVLLMITHPVLLVVTFLTLLVIMFPVLLIKRNLVLPALINLCIPIPNVAPRVKTVKTKCPPPPRVSR